MKYTTLAIAGIIMAVTANAMAADENVVSSKGYVDNRIGTRQAKIPAAGTNSATAGETVVTYTTTGNGTIGERGIYTNPSSYNSSTDANKLATAGALNSAVTNLSTMATTQLTCANPDTCDLWTIDDQTVYGQSGN